MPPRRSLARVTLDRHQQKENGRWPTRSTPTRSSALRSIDEFAARELPDSLLIELDERDEFPAEIVRRMSSGEELGIQLLFVPSEYGGMGGGAFDVYRICERMAAIDLGLATSELATFLGSDPIRVGGTEEQKAPYMGRIAKDGALFAYGATEPEAGSDLGALKTVAEPDDRDRPAADRALLPDRRRVGARLRGPDGAPNPRRPGRPIRVGQEAEPSVGCRHPAGWRWRGRRALSTAARRRQLFGRKLTPASQG